MRRDIVVSSLQRLLFGLGIVLLLPTAAWAQAGASAAPTWDPAAFAALLGEAEKAYLDGSYGPALEKYLQLESTLSAALGASVIPEEQRPRAEQALEVISYQAGRCQQVLGDCKAAQGAFLRLQGTANLSDGTRAKVGVRVVETHICLAKLLDEAGNSDDADSEMGLADELLVDATVRPFSEVLDEKQAGQLTSELEAARSELDALKAQRREQRISAIDELVSAGQCEQAQQAIATAEAEGPSPTLDQVKGHYDQACASPDLMQYAPYAVMGLGGVLIVTAVVLEAVNAGDVDDWEAARDACIGGTGSSCPTAMKLSDDVSGQRITTITLVSLGVAAAGGGAAWWWLTAGSDEGEAVEVSVLPSVHATGADVSLTVRW